MMSNMSHRDADVLCTLIHFFVSLPTPPPSRYPLSLVTSHLHRRHNEWHESNRFDLPSYNRNFTSTLAGNALTVSLQFCHTGQLHSFLCLRLDSTHKKRRRHRTTRTTRTTRNVYVYIYVCV